MYERPLAPLKVYHLVIRNNGFYLLLQISNPLLRISNPLLRISNPLLQISNPLLRISNPLLQISNPLLRISNNYILSAALMVFRRNVKSVCHKQN